MPSFLNYMVTALTVSAHHLYLTGEISRVNPLAFGKPASNTQSHRDTLSKAVCSGEPKFFFWFAPFSSQYSYGLCCRPRLSLNGSASGSTPHFLASKMQSPQPVLTCVSKQPSANPTCRSSPTRSNGNVSLEGNSLFKITYHCTPQRR